MSVNPIYDIIIIGGGPAGLSCGLTLASGIELHSQLATKRLLILDSDHSDAKRGMFNNALGIPRGTDGVDLIKNSRKQVLEYDNIEIEKSRVKEVTKEVYGQEAIFSVSDANGQIHKAIEIVIATGFRGFSIKGLQLPLTQFPKSKNNSRVMIDNHQYQVEKGIYVCGLLSGHSSQWAIATGSGAQVGVDIMSKWCGEWKVVHDKNGK